MVLLSSLSCLAMKVAKAVMAFCPLNGSASFLSLARQLMSRHNMPTSLKDGKRLSASRWVMDRWNSRSWLLSWAKAMIRVVSSVFSEMVLFCSIAFVFILQMCDRFVKFFGKKYMM